MENRNKFNQISTPAPPAAQVAIPLGTTYQEFQSRKQIEEEIMEALRSKKFRTMGISGMGGVGKTTMAKKVMIRVREENLFDEILMVVVSQQIDMLKIQDGIAESLGLTLGDKTLSSRANQLRARLTGGKKILIVLDDVWKKLKLEELGIPCESDFTGCNILLTSRNSDELRKMDVGKVFEMKILSKTEAWDLFRKTTGIFVDDPINLLSTAKKVAEECKGLPIALITVGSALKDQTSTQIWKDALDQLQSANPEDMPDVIKDVYNALEMSYNFLENRHAKSLFLLCCLFPEDASIALQELTWYCMGLCMFGEIRNLEKVRNRVFAIVDTLKSRFLLLKGYDEYYVRMHDVVRDVAIYIASKEGLVDQNLSLKHCSREESINCTWMSMIEEHINTLAINLSFPSLRLLSMYNSPNGPEISIIPTFFQGMKELNVLSFRYISIRSLPETTKLLKNLRTLCLHQCESLETISIVGQLLSLEILICRSCNKIAELPVEIRRLERLKLLEVSNCSSLKRIAPEVISKLVQLEELIIVRSFVGWERKANGKQRVNAALCELEHLKNLTRLDIEIEDVSLVTEEMCLSTKIVNHHIRFMSESSHQVYWINIFHHESGMDLILGKDITLARWIHVFLRSSHSLSATGDGSNNLDLTQGQNLKRLICSNCSTMNKLVNITTSMDWSCGVFPFLEYLEIRNVPNLEEICKLPKASNSFGNLKELTVHSCLKLRKLFQVEEVFANEENEKDGDECHMITFPKLKELVLHSLPKLTTFCKGSDSIKFPLLNKISIRQCRNLKSLISGSCNNLNLEGHDADSFHLFYNQKVSFGNLMKIEIQGLHHRKLFSSAIIKHGLLLLENLRIANCKMMEEVFSNEENGMDGVQCHTITFPKLKSLALCKLPRLTSFCKGSESIEFPLLERIDIINCEKLTSLISSTCDSLNLDDHDSVHLFCNLKVSFGRLEEISVRWCDGIRSLFSFSISKNLVNLKKLEIWDCNEMVKVIEDSDEEILAADQKPHLLFPSLNYLRLDEVPNLQCFYNWRCEMQLPSLERVEINDCPLLELESAIFGNLKEIHMWHRDNISALFSSSIAKKLVNLEGLIIGGCNEMVKVIEDIDEEMLANDQIPHLLFPSLKKLNLHYLPKLQSFCNWRCDFQLPSLINVAIISCPLLEFITMGSVSLGSLKEIGYQIPLGLFSQLEYINFKQCNGIRSLFSFSISENLVNLKELFICDCNEMVKVIEDIDEEMLAADQNPHLLFPKLDYMSLNRLPKLQSFCIWRYGLKMPSLKHVEIIRYPLLEFFTMGSVSTPNLRNYYLDGSWLQDVEDLNSKIQLHFETNQHQPISTPKETTSSHEEESETDQAENEMEKTEMEEETNTSSDIQAGAEEEHQKSEIQEAEQINEEFTLAQMKE